MRTLRFVLPYLLLLMAVAPSASAQMVGGTISGEVVDAGGAAIAQAQVLIRNEETGSERKFLTAEGGTFSAPAGLNINAATGVITPSLSTAGTYTVTYTIAAAGGCGSATTTTSVTISPVLSATIAYTGSPWCTSLATPRTVTRTGTAGGTYSATPAGLFINAVTGDITPSASALALGKTMPSRAQSPRRR